MKNIIIYLNILIVLTSCGGNDENEMETPILSSEKKIESFIIEGIETNISQTNKTISIITTASQTDFLFTPKIIVSDKASVTPASETNLDFSNEINFTVTAENDTKQIYKSNLVQKSGLQNATLKLETDLLFETLYYNGVINEVEKKIIFDFPKSNIQTYQYNTYLIINVAGDNTSSIPESDTEIDTETLNTIQINQSEGNETYSIEFRNTENHFTCFSLPVTKSWTCAFRAKNIHDEYKAGLVDTDYVFFTLEDQNVSSLSPSLLSISPYATVTPDSNAIQDFNNDITYEVTSESGVTEKTTVRVVRKKIILTNDHSTLLSNGVSSSAGFFFTRYYAISKITNATLINTVTSEEIDCQVDANDYIDSSSETYVIFRYNNQLNTGDKFFLRVTLENGNIIDTKYHISIN